VPSVGKKKKRKPYRYKAKGLNSKDFKILKSKKSAKIANIESGYYVIVGVFSEAPRAGKRTASLIKRGYEADTFLNTKFLYEDVKRF